MSPSRPSSAVRVGPDLDDVDREVARLATICKVRILDAGVVERVLKNDASACGASNPVGF